MMSSWREQQESSGVMSFTKEQAQLCFCSSKHNPYSMLLLEHMLMKIKVDGFRRHSQTYLPQDSNDHNGAKM